MKYWEIIADRLHALVGVWAGSQRLMPTGEPSGLLTHTVTTEGALFVHADEKLSAFVELEPEVLTVTFYLESIHPDSCQ